MLLLAVGFAEGCVTIASLMLSVLDSFVEIVAALLKIMFSPICPMLSATRSANVLSWEVGILSNTAFSKWFVVICSLKRMKKWIKRF